jgi:DNA polymerase-3 subunit epsilon
MTRFVSIDVETANQRLGSICQIGAVVYENRQAVEQWSTLVNPEQEFRDFNIKIHGITPAAVADSPTLPDALESLRKISTNCIIASYGAFDRNAVSQASSAHGLPGFEQDWLDLQYVVRRAWPNEFTANGWKLKQICRQLGISLDHHHDALCDARAAGDVFVQAQIISNASAHDWVTRYYSYDPAPPMSTRATSSIKGIAPNEKGPLFGEVIVFTGELAMPRSVAAERAAAIGCTPASSVTKKTTLLVVGEQDLLLVGDDGKSTKQEKAEELIARGQDIRILSEETFDALLKAHGI